MQRVCFISRVRPDRLDEYQQRHQQVWSDMTDALRACGWTNYSLFLSEDGLLVGYVETDDFDAARDRMAQTDVNARWQAEMKQFFAADGDQRPDEGFLRLPEIFHLD